MMRNGLEVSPRVVGLLGIWLLSFGHAADIGFSFSAQRGGWKVDAWSSSRSLVPHVYGQVNLTWIATGMTWSSALPRVNFFHRNVLNNNGCWSHSTDSVKTPVSSFASLSSGKSLDDGRIVLEGSLMTLDFDDIYHRTMRAINWTFSMRPESSGAMSFNITTDFPEGSIPSDDRPGNNVRNYKFLSADLSLDWQLEDAEKIVGAGEQFSMANLRGEQLNIWTGEQGIGRGLQPITATLNLFAYPCAGDTHTTYSASPVFLSSRGYGLALDNPQLVNADFTKASNATLTVAFEASELVSPQISGRIWGGKDVRSLMPGLMEITGRMSAPPNWTQEGLVVGDEGGYEIVQTNVDTLLAAKVPVAGVWIQDWSGKVDTPTGEIVWWNWELDEERYPKQFFRNMSAKGIKVLTYVNSFLTSANRTDGKVATVFQEALRGGHLVVDRKGEPILETPQFAPFKFGIVDVFKPESLEWWTNLLKCNVMMACDDGKPLVHAWMHDYGEYFPLNGATHAGGPKGRGSDIHNQYPRYYQSSARAATEEFPDTTFFARSGDIRSPGVARMFWAGDQLTSYDACDGLQSALIGIMTGGFSGWTVTHADIGAFTMINRASYLPLPGIHFKRDSELNIRWLELCVFMNSMYRAHPGLIPGSSSQLWDANMLPHTKAMTELFRDLGPYRQSLFWEAEHLGLPLVRHGILVEPNDPTWFNVSSSGGGSPRCYGDKGNRHIGNEIGLFQFYFGDDVIVAPALVKHTYSVYAYIPKDEWIAFWTQDVVTGPIYWNWDAPLGFPVFFYRAKSKWAPFFKELRARRPAPPSPTSTAEEVTLV